MGFENFFKFAFYYFDDIFHGYEKMDSHQKDQFFELANAYEHIERTNNYHNDNTKISLNYLKEHPKPYPDGFALKVIQITETNRFHNGVFLEMSRSRHLCSIEKNTNYLLFLLIV